jgi:glycosyltransferase involved in cell wall biosynthesis
MDTPGTTTARHRLLLVTHHYFPEHGAPQRRWDTLTPRLVAAGVDVAVLAPPPHYPEGCLMGDPKDYPVGRITRGRHGERIVRVKFREHTSRLPSRAVDQAVAAWSSVRLGLRRFRRRDLRPDVVVGTVPGIPSMFAAWALARAFKAKLIIEMRDAWPDLIEPSGILAPGRSLRSRAAAGARALAHRAVSHLQWRADAVVTTTEAFAHVLRERGVERIAVVRNGTSFQRLERLPDAGTDRGERPFRAVYAGTIGRAQDLETVVRAATEVLRRGHAIEVRLVGSGADVPRLRQLITELDAPVHIGESVPHEDVRRLYEWADTVIVSLRDWKPLEWTVPSKLYEVMASGVYATACVAGEAAELVRNVGAGAVVPPGDVASLADLWTSWAKSAVVPSADPAAAAWVAENADDDVLADRFARLVHRIVTLTWDDE